jgi:hypothetical protein
MLAPHASSASPPKEVQGSAVKPCVDLDVSKHHAPAKLWLTASVGIYGPIEARSVLAEWHKAGRKAPLPRLPFMKRKLCKQKGVNNYPRHMKYPFNKVMKKKNQPSQYFFVLDVDTESSDCDLILIPMSISGVLKGKFAGFPRYKCEVLDSTANWVLGKASEYEQVPSKAMMKTSWIFEEAWRINDKGAYNRQKISGSVGKKPSKASEAKRGRDVRRSQVGGAVNKAQCSANSRLFIPSRSQNEYWDLAKGLSLVRPPGFDHPSSKDATHYHCALCDKDFPYIQGNASNMRRHWESHQNNRPKFVCQQKVPMLPPKPSCSGISSHGQVCKAVGTVHLQDEKRSNPCPPSVHLDTQSKNSPPSSNGNHQSSQTSVSLPSVSKIEHSDVRHVLRYLPPFARRDYWSMERGISLVAPSKSKDLSHLSSKDANQFYCAICKKTFDHEFGIGHHQMSNHWKLHQNEQLDVSHIERTRTKPQRMVHAEVSKNKQHNSQQLDPVSAFPAKLHVSDVAEEAFEVDPSNFNYIPLNSRKAYWDFESGLSLVYPYDDDPVEPNPDYARRFYCAICDKEYLYTVQDGPQWMEAHWHKHKGGILAAIPKKGLGPVMQDSGNHHFIPSNASGKYWDLEKGLSLVYPSKYAPANKEPSIRKVKSFYCALCNGEFPCDPAKGLQPRMAWHWQKHQYVN